MRRAERIIFALGALGEAGEPAALAQRADAVAAAGQDLVRIALMADIPDQLVARRVEQIMQRHRQLDDAEPRAEMAAGDRNGVDGFLPQLGGDLARVFFAEFAEIGRRGGFDREAAFYWDQSLGTSSRLLRRLAAAANHLCRFIAQIYGMSSRSNPT